MDRPLGPRQPDKRITAYESIFGRPGVSHHISPGQSSSTQNYPPPPPTYSQNQYPYPSTQQHYSPPPSEFHNSPYSSHAYLPQPSNPRQSFYAPPPPQNQSWSYPNYPYLQPQYPSHQSSLTPLANNSLAQPIYPPQSDDLSDPSLDRQGLSPTYAYQTPAYHNNVIAHQQPQWSPHPPLQQQQLPLPQQPTYEYEQDLHYQNGSPSHPNIPNLGLNIDVDNGRLGLDFAEESSPSDTDDSELPWAHSRSCTYLRFFETILSDLISPVFYPACSQQTPSGVGVLLSDSPANSRPPPFISATISSRFLLCPLHRLGFCCLGSSI